jgi:hypothetical protein
VATNTYFYQGENGTNQYVVAGKNASSYEYNVAKALDRIPIEYDFQVDLFGGKQVRGGKVLDFLVDTKPLPTPLFVNGEYWHRDNQTELLYLVAIRGIKGWAEPVIFWKKDCDTEEIAWSRVLEAFR